MTRSAVLIYNPRSGRRRDRHRSVSEMVHALEMMNHEAVDRLERFSFPMRRAVDLIDAPGLIGSIFATHANKILKGSKPADLPVEQPTKFEFVTVGT